MSTDDDTTRNSSPCIYYWDLFRHWCSGKHDTDDPLKKDHLLAQRMFYSGCLALPWLWIVNVLYFRIRVYGSIRWWDDPKEEADSEARNGSASDEENNRETDQRNPLEEEELRKWVHRSTIGAILMTAVFTTWTLIFQLNKSSFSDGWFMMSPEDEVASGW